MAPPTRRGRGWGAALVVVAALLVAPPAAADKLLLGRWQATILGSAATLTIITVDDEGRIHGTLHYDPPAHGFGGGPFTTQIENGSFAIRFANGTRYEDLHWCGATLCGSLYTLDGARVQIAFAREPR